MKLAKLIAACAFACALLPLLPAAASADVSALPSYSPSQSTGDSPSLSAEEIITADGLGTPLASGAAGGTSSSSSGSQADAANSGKRVVRVGWYNREAVDAGDESHLIAYERDYLYALSEYADWTYELVPCNWDESLEMLRNHQIDLVCTASKTDERLSYMQYSQQATGNELVYLVAPDTSTLQYNDFAAFNGLRVGYEQDNRVWNDFQTWAAQNNFSVNGIAYDNGNQLYDALNAGEIDAVLQGSFYDVPTGNNVVAKCAPTSVYFATWRGNDELMRQLDDAMSTMMGYLPNFNSEMYDYHFGSTAVQMTDFSPAEQAYLDANPVVVFNYESGWEPIEYEANGQAAGIVPEVLQAIGEDTGIQFEFRNTTSTNAVFDAVQHTSEDAVVSLSYDYAWARQHGMQVTQPILNATAMRVSRGDTSDPKTVALVKNNYLASLIRTKHPDLSVAEYATYGECMDAVARGSVDCTYVNSCQASYYAGMGMYAALSYQSDATQQQGIALATTASTNPLVFSIISKSLQRLSSNTIQSIVDRNTTQVTQASFADLMHRNPIMVGVATAIAILIAGAFILLASTSSSRKRRNRELLEANNAKTDFLGRMSHDIRTPMNAILGYTALAKDEVRDPQAMSHYLDRISESGEYLLALLNDILDMNKIESKQLQLNPQPFSTAECVENVRSIFATQLQQKHLKLEYRATASHAERLMMDRVRYQQIYMNLISNAIKYTPDGGTITVEVNELHRDADTSLTRYSVSDTGCGMTPEFLEKVFEPFTQERNEDRGTGSGLGLAITKSLVELMGGTLHVESEVGRGTRFWFTLRLPLAAPALQRQAAESKPAEVDLTGRHVLVVDDQPMNLEITRTLLEKRHCQVETAANGKEGLEAFEHSEAGYFNLVLMDVRMPVMNGLEATRAIRALDRPDAKTVPIVALSANAYDEDRQASEDAGMNAHLAKPFNVDQLCRLVEDMTTPKDG